MSSTDVRLNSKPNTTDLLNIPRLLTYCISGTIFALIIYWVLKGFGPSKKIKGSPKVKSQQQDNDNVDLPGKSSKNTKLDKSQKGERVSQQDVEKPKGSNDGASVTHKNLKTPGPAKIEPPKDTGKKERVSGWVRVSESESESERVRRLRVSERAREYLRVYEREEGERREREREKKRTREDEIRENVRRLESLPDVMRERQETEKEIKGLVSGIRNCDKIIQLMDSEIKKMEEREKEGREKKEREEKAKKEKEEKAKKEGEEKEKKDLEKRLSEKISLRTKRDKSEKGHEEEDSFVYILSALILKGESKAALEIDRKFNEDRVTRENILTELTGNEEASRLFDPDMLRSYATTTVSYYQTFWEALMKTNVDIDPRLIFIKLNSLLENMSTYPNELTCPHLSGTEDITTTMNNPNKELIKRHVDEKYISSVTEAIIEQARNTNDLFYNNTEALQIFSNMIVLYIYLPLYSLGALKYTTTWECYIKAIKTHCITLRLYYYRRTIESQYNLNPNIQ